MPELGRMSADEAAAMTGLAPVPHDSGTMRGKRRIVGGRRLLRQVLFQAALAAACHNPVLTPFAKRLKDRGKPHKLIITAVARRLTGEQGSAKSTMAKVLRRLIDPAEPITRSAPQSEQDLVIAARNNHVLAFDNLSYIKPSIADALCRIATGGGFGTRKLHTNAEVMLFNATRPCLLNGIPDLASRPDLADRSIIVSLPVIPDTKRQYDIELWKSFDQAAPRILAGLLDAVSTALRRLPEVNLSERPRMADFARWVSAAEPALGWPEGAFMNAYTTKLPSSPKSSRD